VSFDWIDEDRLPQFAPGEQLLLFGAGQGCVELLQWLAEFAPQTIVTAIADNDNSMWGRSLQGYPVIDPATIAEHEFSRIVITTISGEDPVSAQLRAMGHEPGEHFCAVGRYPTNHLGNFNILLELDRACPFLNPGSRILHVGPGGFLGLECSLYALGHEPCSMDAYAFGVSYPDVTERMDKYRGTRDALLQTPQAKDVPDAAERFDSLFSERGGRIMLDEQRMPYVAPARFSSLPFDDASLDVISSFAVLEHVRSPENVVRECRRVLRPGGVAVQRILSRDHRSFGQVAGYHPASYLDHSPQEWEAVNTDKFYQNRVLPEEWRDLFEQGGMRVEFFRTLGQYHFSDEERERLHPDFAHVAEAGVVSVNCDMVVRKYENG
jgi:SAM-dependent methyltransferase